MKKAGLIMLLAGFPVLILSLYDLFGNKSFPVGLSVTGLILSILSVFLGPAFIVFQLPAERQKKIRMYALGFCLLLFSLAGVSHLLHLPGPALETIIAVLTFSFFYGALALKNKYEKWKLFARSKSDAFLLSILSMVDFVGIGAVLLGFLFKMLHWPLANALIIFGLAILTIGVLAWNQKFKTEVVLRKQAEDQIADQHQKLEEKQKEIIDSIRYARRIQSSLLPTEKHIEKEITRLKNR